MDNVVVEPTKIQQHPHTYCTPACAFVTVVSVLRVRGHLRIPRHTFLDTMLALAAAARGVTAAAGRTSVMARAMSSDTASFAIKVPYETHSECCCVHLCCGSALEGGNDWWPVLPPTSPSRRPTLVPVCIVMHDAACKTLLPGSSHRSSECHCSDVCRRLAFTHPRPSS